MKIYWLHAPKAFGGKNDGDFYQFFLENDKKIDEKTIKKFLSLGGEFVTLNPLILNYLSDEDGKNLIHVKTKNGFKKLGDVLEVQWKFAALGVGEVLCDTDFENLS